MCPECHRFICIESCPSYSGHSPEKGNAVLSCTFCDFPIWKEDKFYSIGVRPFCRECLENASFDDLMLAFKFKTPQDLLCALGAVSRTAFHDSEEC